VYIDDFVAKNTKIHTAVPLPLCAQKKRDDG